MTRTWTHLTVWRHGFRVRFWRLSVEINWDRWPRSLPSLEESGMEVEAE